MYIGTFPTRPIGYHRTWTKKGQIENLPFLKYWKPFITRKDFKIINPFLRSCARANYATSICKHPCKWLLEFLKNLIKSIPEILIKFIPQSVIIFLKKNFIKRTLKFIFKNIIAIIVMVIGTVISTVIAAKILQ